MLRYEIWMREIDRSGRIDGRLDIFIQSGAVELTSTRSDPIPLPVAGREQAVAIVFRVIGMDRAYVELIDPGLISSQTGDHATSDAVPRILVGAEDGTIAVPGPSGGTFTAVRAAAVY